jgi:hypothetical protein
MNSGVLQSHTATEQWQSFEIRMRRRRVERCVLRASVAIEAGVLEDAKAALEEVQRLDPYEPALDTLRTQLASAETDLSSAGLAAASSAAPLSLDLPVLETPLTSLESQPRHVWGYAVAALLLVAISGAGGWLWVTKSTPVRPVSARTDVAPPAATVPPAAAPAGPIDYAVRPNHESAVSVPPSIGPVAPETPAIATTGTPELKTDPASALEDRSFGRALSPDASVPAASTPPTSDTAAPPAVATERPRPLAALLEPAPPLADPSPAPVAAAGADGVALSDTAVNVAMPAPVSPAPAPALASVPVPVPPPAPPSSQSDERLVRATLSRYEGAYSSLDAAAASAVWPGVDRRALSSAFQGLSSQEVSLGRCDVRVSGPTAQAECRGTAKWTPKVGGGPQTAARQWRFNLKSVGNDWVITSATVR